MTEDTVLEKLVDEYVKRFEEIPPVFHFDDVDLVDVIRDAIDAGVPIQPKPTNKAIL